MRLVYTSILAGIFVSIASATPLKKRTYSIDLASCTAAQQHQIADTLDGILTILTAVTTDADFNPADRWYQTYFGASPEAVSAAGFADIKLRFQNVRRILTGPGTTDPITLRCQAVCGDRVAAWVAPGAAANEINFCPDFFLQGEYESIFAGPTTTGPDCVRRSGINAKVKPKEQVLLHEFMHLPIITTPAAAGVAALKDRIIDCTYGTYPITNHRQYANAYEVSRINADSYAFLATFRYLQQHCPIANAPIAATDVNYPAIKNDIDPRCYLGDLINGNAGIGPLNTLVGRLAGRWTIPRPLVRGAIVYVDQTWTYPDGSVVELFCPPKFTLVASDRAGMKKCTYY